MAEAKMRGGSKRFVRLGVHQLDAQQHPKNIYDGLACHEVNVAFSRLREALLTQRNAANSRRSGLDYQHAWINYRLRAAGTTPSRISPAASAKAQTTDKYAMCLRMFTVS